MFTTLAIFGTIVLTQIVKRWIKPKWGDTGVHVFVFVVAFFFVSVKGLATVYPPLGAMLMYAAQILAGSIAVYQILLKRVLDATFLN